MDDECHDKVCTVYDHGNNVELAIRLAREFRKVNYFKPWSGARPLSNDLCVGDGFENITRIRRFFDWQVLNETDLFVFPEIYDGDLQLDLERRGHRVWGSRHAERYEYNRELFLKTLRQVGLPCPEYEVCRGLGELREFLHDNDDWWVKMELRGDDETWRHRNFELSRRKLESLAYRFGPIQNELKFVCVKHIESTLEAAYDGFMVTSTDGKPQFPKTAFLGYEDKNKSHILTAIDYKDLNHQVSEVNRLFAPKLAEKFFRSAWGTEIKITDDSFLFLDATCRQPSPPGEIIMEMVMNLGEFMWQGSAGKLIELEIEKPFAAQVAMFSSWALGNWETFEKLPKEVRRWVKFYNPCEQNGRVSVVPPQADNPTGFGSESVAVVLALGDSIEEAIEGVKEHCEKVQGFDASPCIESLAETLSRIKAGEKEGIAFADEVPEPASVIES